MSYADLIKSAAERYANALNSDERLKEAQTLAALEQAAAHEAMANTLGVVGANVRSLSTFVHDVTSKWARAGEKFGDTFEQPSAYNGWSKSTIVGTFNRVAEAIEKRLSK